MQESILKYKLYGHNTFKIHQLKPNNKINDQHRLCKFLLFPIYLTLCNEVK